MRLNCSVSTLGINTANPMKAKIFIYPLNGVDTGGRRDERSFTIYVETK